MFSLLCIDSVMHASYHLTPDLDLNITGYYRPEMFYGKDVNFLNNAIDADKVWYPRHIVDSVFDIQYGHSSYGTDVIELVFSLRNKANWGAPGATAITTETFIKELDTKSGGHVHATPLLLFWMRELWLSVDLVPTFGLPFKNNHQVKIGSFSFELGRGIALGDAFAVGPGILGFYTDDAIDQYAYGVKLSGDVLNKYVSYDWYTSILVNRAFSVRINEEKIYAQEFGRANRPERGFGSVNFLSAFRLRCFPLREGHKVKLYFEPYAVFNHDPEQKVEFNADASSKLGTVGLAGEVIWGAFEAGFDCATNFGQQEVKGWDRNHNIKQNYQGHVDIVNSQVVGVIGIDSDGNDITANVPFVSKTDPAQIIIDNSYQDASQNGLVIGEVDAVGYLKRDDGMPIKLKNTSDRFQNPYRNKFNGWMFVVDTGYWLREDCLLWTGELGLASGDDNPHLIAQDEEYDGFIGLQELYSGKRVKSAFVLGGIGRIRRAFSQPRADQPGRFRNAAVSRFTNLIYMGSGLTWKNKVSSKPFKITPNVLAYWQEKPLGEVIDSNSIRPARAYLGLESNVFISAQLLNELEGFIVASIFFPGSHFSDRKQESQEEIDLRSFDETARINFVSDRVEKLGDDIAYTIDIGIKYSF